MKQQSNDIGTDNEVAVRIAVVIDEAVRFMRENLEVIGYNLSSIRSSRVEKPRYSTTISFTNQSANREICLNYLPLSRSSEMQNILYLEIFRGSKLANESSVLEDYLDVNTFLRRRIGKEFSEDKLSAATHSNDLRRGIRKVLEIYANLVRDNLMDIIKGEKWEEGFFPDWTK